MRAKAKLDGLQVLRFIAASLVVIDHAAGDIAGTWGPGGQAFFPFIQSLGAIGVSVFFMISGFVMVYSQYGNFGKPGSPLLFFLKRCVRIIPLYLIATTIRFASKFGTTGLYSLADYLRSIAFIPYVSQTAEAPVLAQGWTLNYEMFFYVLFALALFMKRGFGLFFVMAALLLMGTSGSLLDHPSFFVAFYLDSILFYFVIGMLAALLFLECRRARFTALVLTALGATLALLVVCLATDNPARLPGLVSLAIMLGCLLTLHAPGSATRTTVSLGIRLGESSYALYLFHSFILGACKKFYPAIPYGHWLPTIVIVAIVTSLANLVCLWIYAIIDRPITISLNKKVSQSALAVRVPS